MTVCGVDVGSLRTAADVAWLDRGRFVLDRYLPSAEAPLPEPPAGMPPALCFALDAPQGLPSPGAARRAADREADTPTRVLPARRSDAAPAFRELVEAGLTLFWAAHERGLPVVETYPRFVIRTLWPELRIPSKRREPRRYVAELWALIRALGYSSRPPGTHDEVDAMLCALAAEAYAARTHVSVGIPAVVDGEDRVLREGCIVAPRRRTARDADGLASVQRASYERVDRALRTSWPPEQAMNAAELGELLDERRYCVLATASERGRAQARPVGFVFHDEAFWVASVAGGRLRNLRREPWASLVVEDGDGASHRALVVDGGVTIHREAAGELVSLWESRFGSRPSWAAAWLELRPARVFSYRRRG